MARVPLGWTKEDYFKLVVLEMENKTKHCAQCQRIKPWSEFKPEKTMRHGLYRLCNECAPQYNAAKALRYKERKRNNGNKESNSG